METYNHIGLIDSNALMQTQTFASDNHQQGYSVKKVWITDETTAGLVKTQYPHVEIVHDKSDILLDGTIQLVILSTTQAKDKTLVEEVIRSGKHMRVL